MIHLIGFYTQGEPFDHAKDLSVSKQRFQSLYEDHVDQLKLYNTTHMMVKNTQFKNYIDSLPGYKFLEGWVHHFFKWKPFVIYEHLKQMDYGDILVYHDCDILKKKEYERGVDEFRENVKKVLEQSDLVCSMDSLYGKNNDSTKEEVFRQFGDYRDTKTLKTNRIFLKKTPKTVQFIYNWLTLCNTTLLNPNYTEKHSYSESLFNVLYYKYIEMGEFIYPNVYFKNDLFSSETILFLDKPKDKPKERMVQKKNESSLFEPKLMVPFPLRRMLPPHQSTRSLTMSMIPIAKQPIHGFRRPSSMFTLNKQPR